ncbi:MAG: DUF192 domain-containing protein [Patescibacteria group bacterium]
MENADEKMAKRFHFGTKGIIALVVLILMTVSTLLLRYQQSGLGSGTVTIDQRIEVSVDVAASDVTRARGLSGRTSLALDQGLLFLFAQPDKYVFWMKDMNFPLDVIWIKDGEIVDLTLDIRPAADGENIPTFAPLFEADAVLEVPAGFAQQHGLKLGLPVTYRIDRRGALR